MNKASSGDSKLTGKVVEVTNPGQAVGNCGAGEGKAGEVVTVSDARMGGKCAGK